MKLHTRLRLLLRLVVVAQVLSLVGAAPASAADDDSGTLRVGTLYGDDTSNPLGGWSYTTKVLSYQPMIGFDENFEVVTDFGSSWTMDADGVTWTYTVEPGKKWSDGEPATAADVAFTMNYILDGSKAGTSLYWQAAAQAEHIASVELVDESTVKVVFKEPSVFPLELEVFVLPEHIWKDVPLDGAHDFLNPAPIVGSGPWILTEWRADQFQRFERNPYWTGPDTGVDEVLFIPFETADALATALQRGEVDAADVVPPTQVASLDADPDIVAFNAALPWPASLSYNLHADGKRTSDAILDVKFRQALGYAIDREFIASNLLNGAGFPTDTMIPEAWLAGWAPSLDGIRRSFDLDKSRQLLEAAGYVDSDGDGVREDQGGLPLELRILSTSDPFDLGVEKTLVAQALTDWFGQVGVKLTTMSLESGSFSEKMACPKDGGGDWDLALTSGWTGGTMDQTLRYLRSDRICDVNYSGWVNDQYDQLSGQALATLDDAARKGLVQQAAALAYDQAPMEFLFQASGSQAYRTDRFDGWLRQPAPSGPIMQVYPPELSIRAVTAVGAAAPSAEPSEAAPSEAAPTTAASASPAPETPATGTSDNSTLLIGGAIVLIVVVVGGVILMRRRQAA